MISTRGNAAVRHLSQYRLSGSRDVILGFLHYTLLLRSVSPLAASQFNDRVLLLLLGIPLKRITCLETVIICLKHRDSRLRIPSR